MSALPSAILSQLLRSSQGGGPMQQLPQLPRMPGARAEDPDFLSVQLQPLEEEQRLLVEQLRRARDMGQPSEQRFLNPLATGMSAVADILRGVQSKGQMEEINTKLAALNEERRGLVEAAGRNPSASAVQRGEAAIGRDFQAGQAQLDREFREQQANNVRAFEDRQLTRRLGAAAKKQEAEAEAARKKAEADTQERFTKREFALRNEFLGLPQVKKTEQAATAFRQLENAQGDNGVSDLQRIFAYVNIIDPGVAVKQEDVTNLGRTGGLPGQAQTFFNHLTAQGSLPPEVRKQMLASGKTILNAKMQTYRDTEKAFRDLAVQYGVDPLRAVPSLGFSPAGTPTRTPIPGGNLELNAPPTEPPGAAAPKPGETKTIGGKTYRLKPNGRWEVADGS